MRPNFNISNTNYVNFPHSFFSTKAFTVLISLAVSNVYIITHGVTVRREQEHTT